MVRALVPAPGCHCGNVEELEAGFVEEPDQMARKCDPARKPFYITTLDECLAMARIVGRARASRTLGAVETLDDLAQAGAPGEIDFPRGKADLRSA